MPISAVAHMHGPGPSIGREEKPSRHIIYVAVLRGLWTILSAKSLNFHYVKTVYNAKTTDIPSEACTTLVT